MVATTADAFKLLMDGADALAEIEHHGICVDEDYLARAIRRTDSKIKMLESNLRTSDVFYNWRREYGQAANLGSREQLATVLFDVMGVPSPGYTARTALLDDGEKKRYRTDKAAMTALVDLPFVKQYEELEAYKKLRGTYLEGLRRETVDGFVHPSLNLHLVKTYRSSSDRINIQNQYNRNPAMAAIVRPALVPRYPDWVFVEPDESQVEVRGICCYNKDPKLIEYVEDTATDMHRDQAARLFFLTPEFLKQHSAWAKKGVRDWSKNRFVFPEFYGSVYFQCAAHLWQEAGKEDNKLPCGTKSIREHLRDNGIEDLGECDPDIIKRRGGTEPGTFVHHVKRCEDMMWKEDFPVYRQWKYDYYNEYRKNGYFDLLTGFREKGLYSRNDVTNHANQGMCFHWVLWALIQIQREFKKRRMQALIVSEIHDCLLIDSPMSEVQDVLTICEYYMTEALRKHWKFIIVPLAIEADVTPMRKDGGNWWNKRPYVKADGMWKPKEK